MSPAICQDPYLSPVIISVHYQSYPENVMFGCKLALSSSVADCSLPITSTLVTATENMFVAIICCGTIHLFCTVVVTLAITVGMLELR